MTGNKKNVIKDFQTTFFVGNCTVTRMLSDIVKNKQDRMFIEALGISGDFSFPFFVEEGKNGIEYIVKIEEFEKCQATIGTENCNTHVINHGDYITFRSKDNTVKALFIEASEINLGYKKYSIERNTNIFIGRMPVNDIACELTDYISREKHAVIRVDGNGNGYIEDLKRTVGIYVNGKKTHSQKLELFDEVYIMGLSVIYMGTYIAVNMLKTTCSLREMKDFTTKAPEFDVKPEKYFVSTPRILKSLDVEEIEVDAPPGPFEMDETPAILTLGPSITMAMVMLASVSISVFNAVKGGNMAAVVASGTMAVGMLAGSLLWPSLLRNYQKKKIAAEEAYRKSKYSSYIAEIEDQLIAKTERAARILNETLYPAPETLCAFLDNEENRFHLWERSVDDEDFLRVRLGIGSRDFDAVSLKVPREGFQLYDDELRKLPSVLAEKYSKLKNVPLALDLANNHTIGIIGKKDYIWSIVNEIILNITALHSCDDVKLIIITSQKDKEQFEKFKNIPHIWSNDKKHRYFAVNGDEVHHIFNLLDETFRYRESDEFKDVKWMPHYCMIVTDPEEIEKEALCRYIEDADNRVGLTTIFAYGDITKLPKTCNTIIQSDENRTGYYIKNKNANKFIPFKRDSIEDERLAAFSDKLTHLAVKRNQRLMGITDRISFLQMYRAGNVSELEIDKRWENNNSAKSLAAPVGVMAGGEIFCLDIHEAYHGCHGLVAGTTGSGKSEFLQAFVLSLAINYSPNEVAFVLVDFKGGDMARPFMEKPFSPALPHLAATISNLSGNVLYRALVSLEAEIKYRQKLFNESAMELGVDKLDINSYHKYYKGGRLTKPLPHLIIIIDEFAQLKTQQPEFLTQLINVAQVGRSLGIHLILATQKPSGIVDPQIMSNSRFKVCLKVAEKQDSIDMLNKPDAAMIKNPGRLYLQVGYNEIYECIQSGYSGADYTPTKTYIPEDEITVQMTDNTANPIHSAKLDNTLNKTDKSQLEAVVEKIVELGEKRKLQVRPLWLEMLPTEVKLDVLPMSNRGLCTATVGLVDYVKTQEQKPLYIDFVKGGHVALYGVSGTGKTTFIQTLIYSLVCGYQYTPEELSIYAIDFGGRNLGYLSKLPQVGGVAFSGEDQKLNNLVRLLHNMVEERKALFASRNCGTFSDYRRVSDAVLPAVVVIIDDYASFRDKYMELAEELTEIIGTGKSFGIYFVITGSTRNSIYYKVTEYISTFFTLRMNDPNNYLDIHNMRPPITPEEISGRGITVINKEIVEFQIALAFLTETDSERVSKIGIEYENINSAWQGYTPAEIDIEMDEKASADRIENVTYGVNIHKNKMPEPLADHEENLILAASKSGLVTYGMKMTEDNMLCVCARDMESFEVCYQTILRNITIYQEREIVLIDDETCRLKGLVEQYPGCKYISGTTQLDMFINNLKPELNARLENEECRKKPLILMISEFNSFFEMMTDEQAAFMRKVFRYIDTPDYGITFICGFNVLGDKCNDSLFLSMVVNAQNYIICSESYEEAEKKIETMPTIYEADHSGCYICLKDKVSEIRW